MEQFSLDKYLENPSRKVVTRDGKPIRIICWDSPNKAFPIVGFIDDNPTVFVWDNYGYSRTGHVESKNDLFFAYEEELTEFEKLMIQFSHERDSLIQFEHTKEEINAHLHLCSEKLLDLARKEIEKENSGFKPKFTYNEKDYSELGNKLIEFRNNTPLFSVSYRDGEGRKIILHYEKEITDLVKEKILKDLPKWKKMPNGIQGNNKLEPTYLIRTDYGFYFTSSCLSGSENNIYIELVELENLPKEE